MTARRTLLALGLSAAVMVGVAGCTGDDSPEEQSPSTSGSSSSSTAVEGTDQSAVVLKATLPTVKGSAQGKVGATAATLNVGDVRVTAGSTVLTFWYTDREPGTLVAQGDNSWENQPKIVDPTGKKVYEPLTFTNTRGDIVCLCTDVAAVDSAPQPRTIAYPAIPDGVASVQVRHAGFPAISVPVTRGS